MKKKPVADAVEYREIVVRHVHPPYNKALISLDKGVETLTAFKQLCSSALEIKVETICDERGTRLSDLRQVWPRSSVVALQKGECWAPPASKFPKFLAHNSVLGVAAVLFMIAYGYIAALYGARSSFAKQTHLPFHALHSTTPLVSPAAPVQEPAGDLFEPAVVGVDVLLKTSEGPGVPKNVDGGSGRRKSEFESHGGVGETPDGVVSAEQDQESRFTCEGAADASVHDGEHTPEFCQGHEEAFTESDSAASSVELKTAERGTAPPACAGSTPGADVAAGVEQDSTIPAQKQVAAALHVNRRQSRVVERAEDVEHAGAKGRVSVSKDGSAATIGDTYEDRSDSNKMNTNPGRNIVDNKHDDNNKNNNNNNNNNNDNTVDGGLGTGSANTRWEESDTTSVHPQGMDVALELEPPAAVEPSAGNSSEAKAGRSVAGYVLVERRRHQWGSDSLFSWAVIGSAMHKLGLQEALPPEEGSPKDNSQAHWDMLLCLTEECSGVDSWRWPDSFSTLAPGQIFNHFPGITELSGRERLFRNLAAMVARYGSEFDVMPETYLLREEAAAFHTALRASPRSSSGTTVSSKPAIWIFKNLSVPIGSQVVFGQGKLLISADTPDQIPTTGQFLTQRYIADPLLLHGRKFTLRLYLLLTSVNPVRLYMYDEGLAHFAVDRYSSSPASLSNSYAHITNEALAARHDEMTPPKLSKPAPGTFGAGLSARWSRESRRAAAEEVRKHRCVMTLRELRAALLKAGLSVDALWRKIEGIAIKAVISAEERLVQYSESLLHGGGRVFELLAMDVLLDRQMRPWLLKITDTVPNLQADTNLKFAMKEQMVVDMFRMVGAVKQGQQIDEIVFEKKITAMTARWGPPSRSNIQMLKEFEIELQMRGSYTLLQPSSVPEGGMSWKRYFKRPNDLMLQRWIEMHY